MDGFLFLGIESTMHWKSVTFRALSTFPEYENQLKIEATNATESVFEMLRVAGFAPNETTNEKMNAFETSIALPLAHLAGQVQSSSEIYEWSWDCPIQLLDKEHLTTTDAHPEVFAVRPWLCGCPHPEAYNVPPVNFYEAYFTLFPALWKINLNDNGGNVTRSEHCIGHGWILVRARGYGHGPIRAGKPNPEVDTRLEYLARHLIGKGNSVTENANQGPQDPPRPATRVDTSHAQIDYLDGPEGEDFPIIFS